MPSYPTAQPNLTNPTGTEAMNGANLHSVQHANANDEIEAITFELGLTPKGSHADVRTRFDVSLATNRMQHSLSGGGVLQVGGTSPFGVYWSTRFICISANRGASFAPAGYFDITRPADGTVITGVGGAANQTVTTGWVPLPQWNALYYILPVGQVQTSIPANFRIVSYTTDFVIPDHWVLIAAKNSDQGGAVDAALAKDVVTFGDGRSLSAWVSPVYINGWVDYNAPWAPAYYRKAGEFVTMRGIIRSGTLATPAFYLPVGWRPGNNTIIGCAAGDAYGEIRIYPDGQVTPTTGNTIWFSLANCTFVPEG